ncbi:Trem-like transcript 2 protein, partial [Lemmus lemmus]
HHLEFHKVRAAAPSFPFPHSCQFQDVFFFLPRPCSGNSVSSGPSNKKVYKKVWQHEGESLTVLCSYKNHQNRAESKAWFKVRKKREPSFIQNWVKGPSYSMQDDAKAKMVLITMEALRVQDSRRYWCMQNKAGNLYPLVDFQLEVYPNEQTQPELGLGGIV